MGVRSVSDEAKKPDEPKGEDVAHAASPDTPKAGTDSNAKKGRARSTGPSPAKASAGEPKSIKRTIFGPLRLLGLR